MPADSARRKRPSKSIVRRTATDAAADAVRFDAAAEAAEFAAARPRAIAPDDRLVRTREVLTRLGVCRSQLHKMVKLKTFPKPLGQDRHCRWLNSDIDRYLGSLLTECESAAETVPEAA